MAGYVPQSNVYEEARFDLDALEMYTMMLTGAYGAADDVYRFGHNAVTSDGTTLYGLATLYDDDNTADDIIQKAISQKGSYSSATRRQAAEIVRRALQSMVSLNTVVGKMQASIAECKNGSADVARKEWDNAVAFYVGSMEGVLAGGRADSHGEWMYALGNEFCREFNSCKTSGEAAVNEQLIFQFSSGRDSLVDGECNYLTSLVPDKIIPYLLIPLIQGTISYSIKIDSGSADGESAATAHILAQAILAQGSLDGNSANTLSTTFASLSSSLASPVASDIVGAFSNSLNNLGISCEDIGSPMGYDLCSSTSNNANDVVVVADNPTNLGDNLYVTTTSVEDRASIALDISDMSDAIMEGNNELAELIYRKGKNSEQFDKNGKFVKTRSLKSFSTESTNDMKDEAEFNMYMYTLGNQFYADQLVTQALANANRNPGVATEAAMVLNLWMEIVHMMHETLQACKKKQLYDDSGVHSMDIAVAYWIGDGQIAGDAENGHLLYALSENLGEVFNINQGGQSRTNTNILKSFNEAKNEVSLPNACSESKSTYTRLRNIVNRLIPQMTIPIIQGLIHSLRSNNHERVKIYAHAFVPLVAACSPSLFDALKEKLLLSADFNVVDVESIIDLIRKSYSCFGLKCDDIGVHETEISETAPKCTDPDMDAHLAGYRPSTDVREYSQLDLDIREMDVLLQMKAYDAVDEIYTYGKHARKSGISLGQFATSKHRSIVPEYDAFVRYYGQDTYADDIIRTALNTLESTWTDEQRRMVVVKSSQVLVMYFAVLQNAYEAVADCNANRLDPAGSNDAWDRAAALLVGSLEGTKKNGTVEGYMLYDLAQDYCVEFGTCRDSTSMVDVNEELVSLFYTGRGSSVSNSCRALEKAADEISSLLLIPIIQGALSTSRILSNGENLQTRAEAYVYSRALAPLIRKRRAAEDLDQYLGMTAPKDQRHTAKETYSALADAYPAMNVDCEMIGTEQSGYDPCAGVVYLSNYTWVFVGVTIGLILILSLFCFFYIRRRRRRRAMLPENNPDLIPSTGELNHSMDLLEKAFSPNRQIPTTQLPSETEALNRTDVEDDNDEHFEDEVDEAAALTSNTPDVI